MQPKGQGKHYLVRLYRYSVKGHFNQVNEVLFYDVDGLWLWDWLIILEFYACPYSGSPFLSTPVIQKKADRLLKKLLCWQSIQHRSVRFEQDWHWFCTTAVLGWVFFIWGSSWQFGIFSHMKWKSFAAFNMYPYGHYSI
jgi:hypothetical protein